jgi:hypothetical protein
MSAESTPATVLAADWEQLTPELRLSSRQTV